MGACVEALDPLSSGKTHQEGAEPEEATDSGARAVLATPGRQRYESVQAGININARRLCRAHQEEHQVLNHTEIKICEVPATTEESRPPRLFRSIAGATAQRLLAGGIALSIPLAVAFMVTSWVLQSGASLPEWIVKTVALVVLVCAGMATVAICDVKYFLIGIPAVAALGFLPLTISGGAVIVLVALVAGLAVGHYLYKAMAPIATDAARELNSRCQTCHAKVFCPMQPGGFADRYSSTRAGDNA